MTEQRNQRPDWIFTSNDNSHKAFLRWVCEGKLSVDFSKPVQVVYGDIIGTEEAESGWQIKTPLLLPDSLLLYKNKEDIIYGPQSNGCDRYLLCVGFPFRTDSTKEMLEGIFRHNPKADVLIVLIDSPRHRGATDLSLDRDEAFEAEKYYEQYFKLTKNVCRIKGPDDLIGVLSWHGEMIPRWSRYIKQSLEILKGDIDGSTKYCNWVKQGWTDKDGPLSNSAELDRFSFFSVQRHNKETLWDNYLAEATGLLFGQSGNNGILKDIVDIYDLIIHPEESLAFWDKEEERNNLWDEMNRRFQRYMEAERPSKMSKRTPGSIQEYDRMVGTKNSPDFGIDAKFKSSLHAFLGTAHFHESKDEVFQVIRDQMYARYNEIREKLEAK